MSRRLNVERTNGWRAIPSSETTVEELARAMNKFGLELLVDAELNVSLVQPMIGAGDPPDIEELAATMFGNESDATLVEETGAFATLEEADEEVGPE